MVWGTVSLMVTRQASLIYELRVNDMIVIGWASPMTESLVYLKHSRWRLSLTFARLFIMFNPISRSKVSCWSAQYYKVSRSKHIPSHLSNRLIFTWTYGGISWLGYYYRNLQFSKHLRRELAHPTRLVSTSALSSIRKCDLSK